MTSKLPVAPWKLENNSVKKRCERKRKRRKKGFLISHFLFLVQKNKRSGKWIFSPPILLPLPWIQTKPRYQKFWNKRLYSAFMQIAATKSNIWEMNCCNYSIPHIRIHFSCQPQRVLPFDLKIDDEMLNYRKGFIQSSLHGDSSNGVQSRGSALAAIVIACNK